MKTVNARLITFGLASLLLAACSDNTSDTPNTPGDSQILGSEVISIPQSQLTNRVRNFKVVKTKMTRAAGATSSDLGEISNMEEEPSVPSDAKTIAECTGQWGSFNLPWGSSLLINTGESFEKSIDLSGRTIYVKGTFKMNGCWGASNIVILKGGKLICDVGDNIFPNGGKILNYGTIETTSNTLGIQNNGVFKNAGNLILEGKKLLVNSGKVFIGGNAKVGEFDIQSNAQINIQGDLLGLEEKTVEGKVDDETHKGLDGLINIGGKFNCKDLALGNACNFYACSINVTGTLHLTGNGVKLHVNHVKSDKLLQDAGSKIYLVNNSVIECGTYTLTTNGQAAVTLEGPSSTAVFKANRFQFNGSTTGDVYSFNSTGIGSQILMDCPYYDFLGHENTNEDVRNQTYEDITWHGGVDNGVAAFKGGELTLKPAVCGYTIVPKDDPTPDPDPVVPDKILDPIGEVDYDHTHNISATCIQPYNGKMYMSYHTRGKGHGACIEVFETDAQKQTKMLQYLQDKEQNLDFNHLMVDSKPATPLLYVVGNSFKKGAILARIDINKDGLLNTDEKVIDENTTIMPLTVVALDKNAKKEDPQDENCIVRDGDKLLVMSTRGYEVYDTDLNLLGSKKTAGKAKHIAINGNNMATLYYDGPVADTIQANGVIEEFTTGSDILTATPTKTIAVGRIAPNNGKNTIAIDGNNLYVCRGSEGLTCFDRTTGNAKWTWKAPLTADTKVVQGNANGVTFDDNYIYLACGGYGVVVLDKNTMVEGKPKVIAKKRAEKRNSANYVTLSNGLVYVAYGKSRLQVFQLIDKPTKVKY